MKQDVGVYQLRCKRSGFVYIGGAERSILNCWSCHRAMVRSGKHYNNKLQADWNLHGERSFVLEVVELCAKKKVRILE